MSSTHVVNVFHAMKDLTEELAAVPVVKSTSGLDVIEGLTVCGEIADDI